MRSIKFAKYSTMAFFLCLGLWPVLAGAGQDWKERLGQTLEAAKREGRVVVIGPPVASARIALADAFQRAFPDIRVEYQGMLPRSSLPRITKEREAGLYLVDILIGGPTSVLLSLKPAGILAPLREALFFPEVLDESKWREGFDGGFNDLEKKFSYSFSRNVSPQIFVNRDMVPSSEFDSPLDLLKPKFAGMIGSDDPRVQGAGLGAHHTLFRGFGEDFLTKLYTQQKILYTRDYRQLAELVIKGQYPIGISVNLPSLLHFQERGIGRNVVPLDEANMRVNNLSVGMGAVSLLDRAPHPNASKVYLNWLLSKDGQHAWNQAMGLNSRRLDVKPGDPDFLPRNPSHILRNPGEPAKLDAINYLITATEVLIPEREHVRNLARQLIPK